MATQPLYKYLWIVDLIRSKRRIKLKDIQSKWEEEFGTPLPRRTFVYSKEAIEELFDINIECDRTTNEYYIENLDDVKRQNTINWMLDSFSESFNLINSRGIVDRIVLEKTPSSQYYLNTVLSAIKQNRVLRIRYKPFGKDGFEMELKPYFVQMSLNRWYLYGVRNGKDKIKAYALDRFEEAEMIEGSFAMPDDFSAEEYLQNQGIGQYEKIPVCEVVIRAYGRQVDLLRTLPLHPSQCEIKSEDGVSEFSYNLRPTTKFYGDILSQGKYIKVLRPAFARKHLAEILEKTLTYYK